jgi:hypothetical protein
MITKELFTKMINLAESFSEETDRWDDFGIQIFELPIGDIPWGMFNCWLESHFDIEGKDWINWYLWERIDTFTKEVLPYYDEDNKPHYLYNAEDLWNLVKNHILDSCKPCILKNSNECNI